jgi:molecular chaperone GrpE
MEKDRKEEPKAEKMNETHTEEPKAEQETEQTPEATKEEVTETEKLQAELAESKDKYLRLYSEFDNFRRRTAREKLELTHTAGSEMMLALLPVLDDFERAAKSFEASQEQALKEGFTLIYHKLQRTLEQKGLKIMEVATGADFDTELHEAITQIPAPEPSLSGKIVDVVEKGYLLNDKVIRFAKVVIGS